MDTIELFMWGYQQHFQISAKVAAKSIFESLDKTLEPKIFLVGILVEEREDRHPVCLEPEDCGYEPRLFMDVREQAIHFEAVNPERNIIHSHPVARQTYDNRLKVSALRQAIQAPIQLYDEYQNTASFCSYPVLVQGYMVSTVLQLNRQAYNSYYSLSKERVHGRMKIATSLLDAAVTEFLNGCTEALTKPDPGAGLEVIGREADEIIRSAGKSFMYTPAWVGGELRGLHGLYHACNTISSMRYEGAEGIGKMVIAKPDHPNVEVVLALSAPVHMKDHRAVRKLLEISSNETCLLTNSAVIFGIGKTVGLYDQRREDLFVVNFTKHYTWEVLHADHVMMRVSYGQPNLPRPLVSKDRFIDNVRRIFRGITSKQIEKLWALVLEATKQKHGTMVVVSSKAQEETDRLEKQSIKIEPTHITPDIIKLVTSIDGAVLVDENAICYAIGVILDGVASEKGSSSRGARYNSAIRYTESRDNTLAIVVSVDGSVDLIPNLLPQISRFSIEEVINRLRKLSEEEELDVKKFNEVMTWLSEHQFYLLPEMCEEINRLRRQAEEHYMADTTVRVVHGDFAPSKDMNLSYFLEE